ncbi:MAG TPA: alpha-glucosidase [Actinomycetota bacterium]|nr:alpha-glucosidase [Actinomycetota bacterium]
MSVERLGPLQADARSPRAAIPEGVIYQVYVRSFADGNGDGMGDLLGLTARLDHVVRLGVDTLWLNPIHPSGEVDMGYDVTDYWDVDPALGGMEAFDRFLGEAHRRGLRVLIDFVPNHTSDRHPWFVESRASRDSPRRGWYCWADPRDGDPPNNWLSAFRGSAWVWDERTAQYYLASFYPEQPDLNWENPEVRRALGEALRFWVERGVDGFRLDAVQRLSKDPDLRDNPPRTLSPNDPDAVVLGSLDYPEWLAQHHVHDQNGPREHEYLRELRRAAGPDAFLLGEVWHFELGGVASYLAPDQLDLAFNFRFSFQPWDARAIGDAVDAVEATWPEDAWPCYHLSNHDAPRHATRYGERAVRPAAVLLLTLRGTPVLYQGEEIGMVDGVVPTERRRDRAGRDPCRTPMQWDGSPNAGFCPPDVEPWLPLAPGHEERNVARQARDPDSVLALYRRLLALRRSSVALRRGRYRRLPAPEGCLAYLREAGTERLAVAVNFTSEETAVALPEGTVAVHTSFREEGEEVRGLYRLGGDQAVVAWAS